MCVKALLRHKAHLTDEGKRFFHWFFSFIGNLNMPQGSISPRRKKYTLPGIGIKIIKLIFCCPRQEFRTVSCGAIRTGQIGDTAEFLIL